ncbi:MAG TPA: ACT domain-containing protein [Methanomassiliicoccales archaeon]|nr:ACT domain-containing protein [Methanomassiliicoccales archaeon]
MVRKHMIKQLSVFLENKPGRLARISKALEEEGINILAFSIAEADGFGVIRALVDDPDKAHNKLVEMGFTVSFTEVIAVQMRDEPGGLFEVASILGDENINIDYSYAFSGRKAAVLILRVDKVEEAIRNLVSRGIRLLEEKDLTSD